jgi:hypothetical protein
MCLSFLTHLVQSGVKLGENNVLNGAHVRFPHPSIVHTIVQHIEGPMDQIFSVPLLIRFDSLIGIVQVPQDAHLGAAEWDVHPDSAVTLSVQLAGHLPNPISRYPFVCSRSKPWGSLTESGNRHTAAHHPEHAHENDCNP